MKLWGIGIDVVEIKRIEQSLSEFGERFRDRIFTAREQAYCEAQKRPAIHYAARFATKEAVAKALGTGIGVHAGWCDIEVIRKESGEPEVVFSGAALLFVEENDLNSVKVSLTHAEHYAAANAVVLQRES